MKSGQETEKDSRDEFDNSFYVPLPPAEAWRVLMDIRRIAPCIPGAELTEVVDDRTYQGTISVPLGPVAFGFDGVMKFEELDPANQRPGHRLLPARAGRGWFQGVVHMELMLSGGIAQ